MLTNFLSRLLGKETPRVARNISARPTMAAEAAATGSPIRLDSPSLERRNQDPWFWSHYFDAAGIVVDLVPPEALRPGRTILDFGCGDGSTSLGVATRVQACVTGLDLYKSFLHLPELARKNLGLGQLPANLRFLTNEPGSPFPIRGEAMDLVYSWSVFEHLERPADVLREIWRITKPGGWLFVQVDPLYYSPFGSHLQRLVKEPWAHLLHGEEAYLGMANEAADDIDPSEQDTLYRTHAFDELKRHLIEEYRRLNRVTAKELHDLICSAGFAIASFQCMKAENVEVPGRLLDRYAMDDLLTQQVVVLARKPG